MVVDFGHVARGKSHHVRFSAFRIEEAWALGISAYNGIIVIVVIVHRFR